MKGARKREAPQELTSWLGDANEDWQPTYPFPQPPRDAVIRALYEDQRGLCVYCGRGLKMDHPGESFHVEHFRPQHKYAAQAVLYENLYLSCGQKDKDKKPSQTCGKKKDKWFDEDRHVLPIYPDCTQRFKFLLTGAVVSANENDEAAKEMIACLNLDHRELQVERRQILYMLDDDRLSHIDMWHEDERRADSYAHVAYRHVGEILP